MDFKLQPGAQLTHPQGLTQVSDWGSECREQRCSLKDDGYLEICRIDLFHRLYLHQPMVKRLQLLESLRQRLRQPGVE